MGQISVIGCGIMGRAVIQTLAAQGKTLVIWNRTLEKAQALVQPGVTVAESFANALASSAVIIFILADPDYAATTALLEENRTHIAGKTIVQLSTGTPTDARKLSEFVTKLGGAYLEGGIMVVPSMVGTSQAMILYSGERTAFMALESTLSLLGPSAFQAEDPGAAAILDMAFNVAVTPTVIALLQGLKICELEKLPPQLYVNLIKGCFIDYILTEVEWSAQPTTKTAKEQEYTTELLQQVITTLSNYLKHLKLDPSLLDASARLCAN